MGLPIDKFPTIIKLKRKNLYVGKSPKVLNDIDIDLPIVINPSHVEMAIEGKFQGKPLTQKDKDDHVFDPRDFALLPDKIANPIAIIHDRRYNKNLQKYVVSDDSFDIYVEMTVASGKQVVVPISVTNTEMNKKTVLSLMINSVHGKTDAIDRLIYALQNDSDTNNTLFYVNKGKTTNILKGAALTHPQGSISIPSGFTHKVTDSGSPVKNKFSNINSIENYNFSLNDSDEMAQFYDELTGDKQYSVNEDGTTIIRTHKKQKPKVQTEEYKRPSKPKGFEFANRQIPDHHKTETEKRHQIYSINKMGEDNIHTAQTSENRSHHELRVLPSSPNLSVTENSDNGKSNDGLPIDKFPTIIKLKK